MSLFLHVCCAPCLLYPARILTQQQISFTCYFFNPNIHPYREFKARLNTFISLAEARKYSYLIDGDYGLKSFLRSVVFQEDRRCLICYRTRLERTFQRAFSLNYPSVSTTLLYSTYQNHHQIRQQAENLSSTHNIHFMYHDFRHGWQDGIKESITLNLYRQAYCGCVYSEQERYDNKIKKQLRKKEVRYV
jgi:epoxyqueuosine reductase